MGGRRECVGVCPTLPPERDQRERWKARDAREVPEQQELRWVERQLQAVSQRTAPRPPPPSVTDGALALGVAMGENLQGKPRHAWRVTGTQPLPVPSPDSSSAMFPLNLSHQGKGQGRCSVCSIVQPRRQRQGVGRTGVTHDHPSSQLGCWNKNRSLGGSSNRHLSPLRLEAGRLRLRCPQTCLLVRTLLLARGRPPSPWVTYHPDDVEGELWSLLLF